MISTTSKVCRQLAAIGCGLLIGFAGRHACAQVQWQQNNSFGSSGQTFGSSGQGSFGTGFGGSFGQGFGSQQGGFQQGGNGQGGPGGMQQGPLQQGQGGNRGFVGNDAQDAQNMFQNMNGRDRRRAMFNFALDSLNEMRDQRRRWREQNRRPPPARVTLTPEIDVAAPAPIATAGVVNQRLTDVMAQRGVGNASVAMEGRTAVLTGTVATEHDKLLAAKLVEIEPGVSDVDNRLTIAAQ